MAGLNDLSKEGLAAVSKTLMDIITQSSAVVDYLEENCKSYDCSKLKGSIGGMVEVLQDVLADYQVSIQEKKN